MSETVNIALQVLNILCDISEGTELEIETRENALKILNDELKGVINE